MPGSENESDRGVEIIRVGAHPALDAVSHLLDPNDYGDIVNARAYRYPSFPQRSGTA
jgi:hypothetical protein